MTKRVIECNICGEALAAATDEELLVVLRKHAESEHSDAPFDEGEARTMIGNDAYEAGDS